MKKNLPTISVILYTSKKLANNSHPIMLRVCYNGERKYKSIGLSCSKAMWISFVMNAVALVLSVLMLISWKSVYGETTLPTLTSLNAMNANWMVVVYGICLLLCLISTAVTTTFGFVARFENIRVLKNVENPVKKRIIVSAFIIIVSMTISLAGLTNIIK